MDRLVLSKGKEEFSIDDFLIDSEISGFYNIDINKIENIDKPKIEFLENYLTRKLESTAIHDFNNSFGYILGFMDMKLSQPGEITSAIEKYQTLLEQYRDLKKYIIEIGLLSKEKYENELISVEKDSTTRLDYQNNKHLNHIESKFIEISFGFKEWLDVNYQKKNDQFSQMINSTMDEATNVLGGWKKNIEYISCHELEKIKLTKNGEIYNIRLF